MGAHTALVATSRYPDLVSHLVMIEGDVGGGGDAALTELKDAIASWPVPFPDRTAALDFFGGESEPGRTWTDGLEVRADGLWPRWDLDVMVETMAPIFYHEHWQEWKALPQETLLVLGERSLNDAGRIDRMLALRPSTHRVTIENAGHDLHLEQPDAWHRALDAFLEG